MLLFFKILATMFIAEMGDKTQLVMIAMTSRYKLRDIITGSVVSIMLLNLIAVAFGAILGGLIPTWLIKIIAGAAFFYFAWSTLKGGADEDEGEGKHHANPILAVFITFFIAEFGDKTQLTAITFAASSGLNTIVTAVLVWAACSIGLFAADLIGMLVGYLLKKKTPEGFFNTLAFLIFAIFGFITIKEGVGLREEALYGAIGRISWIAAICSAAAFVVICVVTFLIKRRAKARKAQEVPKSQDS